MNPNIEVSPKEIADFCRRWDVSELALFGSVLRDDFGPDSDVDVLVRFDDRAHPTLIDLEYMEEELESIFGRDVDLVSRRGVEASRNRMRRDNILASARVIYEA